MSAININSTVSRNNALSNATHLVTSQGPAGLEVDIFATETNPPKTASPGYDRYKHFVKFPNTIDVQTPPPAGTKWVLRGIWQTSFVSDGASFSPFVEKVRTFIVPFVNGSAISASLRDKMVGSSEDPKGTQIQINRTADAIFVLPDTGVNTLELEIVIEVPTGTVAASQKVHFDKVTFEGVVEPMRVA